LYKKTGSPYVDKDGFLYNCLCLFFFFLLLLGLNSGPYACQAGALPLEPSLQPFFRVVHFWDRVLRTIYTGWFWTSILLISAS
jgi:hypothetical protein